jgi:hypothetical protein
MSYQLKRLIDSYRTKFLLCSFFAEWSGPQEYCLYLDPDHIALRPLLIEYPNNDILVSSELKPLKEIQAAGQLGPELQNKHFNTSVVFGRVDLWKEVVVKWEEAYKNLLGIIPMRYLEEVAFSFAAKQANVTISPIDSAIQSNFFCFNKECSIFHYGGENPIAISAKKILGSRNNVRGSLEELSQRVLAQPEKWFLDALIDVLSQNKEGA